MKDTDRKTEDFYHGSDIKDYNNSTAKWVNDQFEVAADGFWFVALIVISPIIAFFWIFGKIANYIEEREGAFI